MNVVPMLRSAENKEFGASCGIAVIASVVVVVVAAAAAVTALGAVTAPAAATSLILIGLEVSLLFYFLFGNVK